MKYYRVPLEMNEGDTFVFSFTEKGIDQTITLRRKGLEIDVMAERTVLIQCEASNHFKMRL